MNAVGDEPDTVAIRAAINARQFSEPMKAALRLALDGESYRRAAETQGVGWREVHKNAATVDGLCDAHKRAWRDQWGPAFPNVWPHHLRRLDEPG